MPFYQQTVQLILRIALGVTLLAPVADRLGWIGILGETNISWGSWANFVLYTQRLNPFVSADIAKLLAVLSTIGEAGFGMLLIMGLFTRWAALGASLLTGLFALSMMFTLGVKAPINYSVWVDCSAGLLLATLPTYTYSFDNCFPKKRPSILF